MKCIKNIFYKLLIILFTSLCSNIYAAKVDSIMIYSPSMDKLIEGRVVTPDCYADGKRLPAVYLLHGYSGSAKWWVDNFPLAELADKYSVIIVAPDGGYSSWYWDSPIDETMKYETFTSKELIDYIDSKYLTIADRKARAIAGISMGGQGAIYLALRHQDIFGAVGSMSGGVDIRHFPQSWHMSKRLGTIEEHPENWEEFTIMNMLDLLKPNALALSFDCGVDDIFYDVNNTLHEELVRRKIPHRYTTAPGAHNLHYWRNSIIYNFLFFNDFF